MQRNVTVLKPVGTFVFAFFIDSSSKGIISKIDFALLGIDYFTQHSVGWPVVEPTRCTAFECDLVFFLDGFFACIAESLMFLKFLEAQVAFHIVMVVVNRVFQQTPFFTVFTVGTVFILIQVADSIGSTVDAFQLIVFLIIGSYQIVENVVFVFRPTVVGTLNFDHTPCAVADVF